MTVIERTPASIAIDYSILKGNTKHTNVQRGFYTEILFEILVKTYFSALLEFLQPFCADEIPQELVKTERRQPTSGLPCRSSKGDIHHPYNDNMRLMHSAYK